MPTLSKQLLLTASLVLVSSCTGKNAEINLSVSAKRLDGSAVALASVTLDDERIGETNAFGTFKLKTNADATKQHTLTVSFDDPSYYYSPHQETFQAHADRENIINVRAVMYLAPKPKVTASRAQKPQDLLQTESSVAAEEQTSAAHVATTDQAPQLLEIMPNDLFELPDATAIKPEQKTGSIFTAHVFSGAGPISGADVIWTERGRNESSCTTNERGRCVLTVNPDILHEGSLLVRKAGYQSAIKTLTPKAQENIRMNLAAGVSLDLQVFSRTDDHDLPMKDIHFGGNGFPDTSSDSNGYAIIPLANPALAALTVTIPGKQPPVKLDIPDERDRIWPLRIASNHISHNKTLLVHDVHIPKDANVQVSPNQIDKLLAALLAATNGIRANSSPRNYNHLQPNQLAIVPVLSPAARGFRLKLIAADKMEGRIWSKESTDDLKFDETLAPKVEGLVFDLKQRLPIYGIVKDFRDGELSIAIDPTEVKIGDLISIRSDLKPFDATISEVKENRVAAKPTGQQPNGPSWLLWGAKAIKRSRNTQDIIHLRELLADLDVISPEQKSIAAAKKLIAEHDPQKALKILEIDERDELAAKIMKLNMSAQVYFSEQQNPEALRKLYQALELAASSRLQTAIIFIEININRVKADTLLSLAGDSQLIEALHELDLENSRLRSAYAGAVQKTETGEQILQQTSFILKQKITEAEQKSGSIKI